MDVQPQRPAPPRSPRDRVHQWVAWFGAGRLLAGCLAVVAVSAGAFWLLRPPRPPVESKLPYASSSSSSSSAPRAGPTTAGSGAGGVGATDVAPAGVDGASVPVAGVPASGVQGSVTAVTDVVVHVAGAVANPGVYHLAGHARVLDAVSAAGGLSADSNGDAINLAAEVHDGERVYIPRVGEPPPPAAAGPGTVEPGTSTDVGPVNVNTATAEVLDGLPGVGPSTAAAIIAYRDLHGPFQDVQELSDIRGIGPAKLAALQGLVTV